MVRTVEVCRNTPQSMKSLATACVDILDQLENAFQAISEKDFKKPSTALGGSTVGQHLRHTIEFFTCLEDGLRNGVVNYDKRSHNKQIETDLNVALLAIRSIRRFVEFTTNEGPLTLEVGYDRHNDEATKIPTSFKRELAYNIEHAVHHMAIIKIGFRDVAPYVILSNEFGVAVSTIRHSQYVN